MSRRSPAPPNRKVHFKIIIFLVILNIISLSFFLYKTNPKTIREIENPYPLVDFSRSFISQEHYIVNIQPLRESVREIAREFGEENVSVYIEFLNTGANIAINPDVYVWPASLTKVPLAMAVVKKIEKKEWEFHNELVLMPGDANDRSGDGENPLSEYPVGTRFTLQKLLEELLVNSDNTAYYILLRNLHQDDLKEVVQSLGMEALFSQEGKISSKEYSRILRSLYTASFLSRENSEKILELLAESPFDNFLAREIPGDIVFPHKYGVEDQERAYSDSGIVYIPKRPYIISVMVQGDPSGFYRDEQEKAGLFMSEISKEAYQYFLTAQNTDEI